MSITNRGLSLLVFTLLILSTSLFIERLILYVSHLPPNTTKETLENLFGIVKSVRIPRKLRLGNYAFIECNDMESYKVSCVFKIYLLTLLIILHLSLERIETRRHGIGRKEDLRSPRLEKQEAYLEQIKNREEKKI
jgi:hypothetical protein